MHGQFYENTVVVQYDKDLLEVWDEAKRLRCEWFNDYEKTASKPPMVIADLDVIQLDFRGIVFYSTYAISTQIVDIVSKFRRVFPTSINDDEFENRLENRLENDNPSVKKSLIRGKRSRRCAVTRAAAVNHR